MDYIQKYHSQGGHVVGICGGYQMLGKRITDSEAVESEEKETMGFGLFSTTIFEKEKAAHQVQAKIKNGSAWAEELDNYVLSGYEIHMGETTLDDENAWLSIDLRSGQEVDVIDGAISHDGRVWGCYIHGIFENTEFRRAWLKSLGWGANSDAVEISFDSSLDELADAMEEALDMDYLDKILGF